MSYCRFSSADWACDVYCYEADEVWVTSIAGSRVLGDIPKLDWSLLSSANTEKVDAFAKQHSNQMAFMKTASHESIDLPYSGQTFEDNSLHSMYSRLLYLREIGYRVPESVMEAIGSEMAEETE